MVQISPEGLTRLCFQVTLIARAKISSKKMGSFVKTKGNITIME
jgi:hypothetical protein